MCETLWMPWVRAPGSPVAGEWGMGQRWDTQRCYAGWGFNGKSRVG